MEREFMAALFREGRVGELRLGVSIGQVRSFLGASEAETRRRKGPWLGKFGALEVACDPNGCVSMILLACWRARRGELWPTALRPHEPELNLLANSSLRTLLRLFQTVEIAYDRVPLLCVPGDQLVLRSAPQITATVGSHEPGLEKVIIFG